MSQQKRERGEVKFILLHHEGCPRADFHYVIDADGGVTKRLAESAFAQHPGAIAIAVAGRYDEARPDELQIDGLKGLLVDLVMRYPSVEIGAHRQVRGDIKTTCPGRQFPVRELAAWCKDGLVRARDERIQRALEEQYSKI